MTRETKRIRRVSKVGVMPITHFLYAVGNNKFKFFCRPSKKIKVARIYGTRVKEKIVSNVDLLPVTVKLENGGVLRRIVCYWTYYPKGNELGQEVINVALSI